MVPAVARSMTFEFATAARIRFGPGVVREVPELARRHGRQVLLVTGRSADRTVSQRSG